MKRFENKVVFITGGASGIGKAAAIAAAAEGANVVIGDLPGSHHEELKPFFSLLLTMPALLQVQH